MEINDPQTTHDQTSVRHILVGDQVLGLPIAHINFSDAGKAHVHLVSGRNLTFEEPVIVRSLQASFGYVPPPVKEEPGQAKATLVDTPKE